MKKGDLYKLNKIQICTHTHAHVCVCVCIYIKFNLLKLCYVV